MAYSLEDVLSNLGNVSCVEGDEANLFCGSSDGHILHYVIHKDDAESDSLEYTYLLASKQESPGRKPPRSIHLLPSVQLAAVEANETLSFYTLPEFAPASELRIVKDVQGVIQNSDKPSRIEPDGSASLTIYTKKKIRQLRVSRLAIKLVKEVEYAGCMVACQQKAIVCVATRTSYDLIDLDQRARIHLFPVVQGESEPVGDRYDLYKPLITSVSSTEFLLASGSPESPTAMGMFVTLEGEITRGTLMYTAYPLRMIASYPDVYTLLSNGTIEVHQVIDQSLVQTLLASGIDNLVETTYSLPVVSKAHLQKLVMRQIQEATVDKPDLANLNQARLISGSVSSFLATSPAGIQALSTSSFLLAVDRLIDDNETQDALERADAFSREVPTAYAERLYHELAYIHQRAGLRYFSQMLFDDAIDNFKKGDIDPRILISMYPEFDGEEKEVLAYAGVIEALLETPSVDEIISGNLKQNVEDEATLAELQVILKTNATEVLRRYLTQYREKKSFASVAHREKIFAVLDKTLLSILLLMDRGESSAKLKEFFSTEIEGHEAIIDLLREHKRWHYLAEFYAQRGQHVEAIETWQSLATGQFVDEDFKADGFGLIKSYLLMIREEQLIEKYGLWLLRIDIPIGITLFTQAMRSTKMSLTFKDILSQLRSSEADRAAYSAMLEHLVLVEQVDDVALTNELLLSYAKSVVEQLKDEDVKSSVKGIVDAYRALPVPKVPFLAFTPQVNIFETEKSLSDFHRVRTNLIDLLQGDICYDANEILNIILSEKDILLSERILLYGRLTSHQESLNLLVHDLKDFESAEVYCYHGGISLSQIRIYSDKEQTVVLRKKLFLLLFVEFLKLEDYGMQFTQGSNLLNRWGNYMDIAAVLTLLPDHWSIELVSNFLVGALSQLAGQKREAQIRRSLMRLQLQRQSQKKFVVLE